MDTLCDQVKYIQQASRNTGSAAPLDSASEIHNSASSSMSLTAHEASAVASLSAKSGFLEEAEDIRIIYGELTCLTQGRWYNTILTRYHLCLLAMAFEKELQGLTEKGTQVGASRGKVRASSAKDSLWAKIFPGQSRTDVKHCRQARAFDRRILCAQRWALLTASFGLGLILLVPMEFPDSWLERLPPEVTALLRDYLAARHPAIGSMSVKARLLLRGLLESRMPTVVPTEATKMQAWLCSPCELTSASQTASPQRLPGEPTLSSIEDWS